MDSLKTKIGEDGRIVIPAEYRKKHNIKPGDTLVLVPEKDHLMVLTFPQLIKRVQARVRKVVPEGVSLVDELIAERRAEAERE